MQLFFYRSGEPPGRSGAAGPRTNSGHRSIHHVPRFYSPCDSPFDGGFHSYLTQENGSLTWSHPTMMVTPTGFPRVGTSLGTSARPNGLRLVQWNCLPALAFAFDRRSWAPQRWNVFSAADVDGCAAMLLDNMSVQTTLVVLQYRFWAPRHFRYI